MPSYLDFNVDSVDGTYLLHEAREGRVGEAPHDVVGWLRQIHAERRRRFRRGLVRLGVEGERIEALMEQLRRHLRGRCGHHQSLGEREMDETPEEWVERLFEFEYCPECGGDAGDHEVCLVPGIGNYFARCRITSPGIDDPDDGRSTGQGALRRSPSEMRTATPPGRS